MTREHWPSLGEILDEQDDPVAALAAYEKAAGIDPSAVPAATMARARDRVAVLKLPAPYRAIPGIAQVTRGDLAALLGVRLQTLVARAAERQVVITDVRGHWAQDWITAVVRASIMDTLPNYQFQPDAVVRRGDLARTVSRVLSLIEALRPAAAAKWRNARVTVSDVAPTHLSYPAVSVAVASGVMPLEGGAFRLLRASEAGRGGGRDQPSRSVGAMTAGPVFTIANQLTLLRMLLIPAFVLLVVYGQLRLGAAWCSSSPASPMRSTASSRGCPARRASSARGSTRWPTSCCW